MLIINLLCMTEHWTCWVYKHFTLIFLFFIVFSWYSFGWPWLLIGFLLWLKSQWDWQKKSSCFVRILHCRLNSQLHACQLACHKNNNRVLATGWPEKCCMMYNLETRLTLNTSILCFINEFCKTCESVHTSPVNFLCVS